MDDTKKKSIIKTIIYVSVLLLTPIIIGLPFTLGFDNKIILEVSFAIFGLLELLAIMIMIQAKQRRLYKTNTTNSDFKRSPKYQTYRSARFILLITAIINLVLSFLYHYIFVV